MVILWSLIFCNLAVFIPLLLSKVKFSSYATFTISTIADSKFGLIFKTFMTLSGLLLCFYLWKIGINILLVSIEFTLCGTFVWFTQGKHNRLHTLSAGLFLGILVVVCSPMSLIPSLLFVFGLLQQYIFKKGNLIVLMLVVYSSAIVLYSSS